MHGDEGDGEEVGEGDRVRGVERVVVECEVSGVAEFHRSCGGGIGEGDALVMSDEEKHVNGDNGSSSSTEATTTTNTTDGHNDVGNLEDVQPPPGCRSGRCKWFNVLKGFGFLIPDDGGPEVFVHQSVLRMDGFRSLDEGEVVDFLAEETQRGWEATFVAGAQGSKIKGSSVRPIGKKRNKKIRCFNCGQYGTHIASKCNQGPLPKCCYHCKGTDHLVGNCPQRPNDRKGANGDLNGHAPPTAPPPPPALTA